MITVPDRTLPSSFLRETIAVVLAGGQGTRLYPLTKNRAKPAVPFGGSYRIIDFTLSNSVNSGLRRILILTQYKSLSLDRHLQMGWSILRYELGEFILHVPPQQRMVRSWYEGTADAIFQNIYILEEQRPKYTVILSGDHVYLMDYAPMVASHVENRADLTVATVEVPKEDANRYGVMQVEESNRVVGFREKPTEPECIPGKDSCQASMGVYVFTTEALVRRVVEDAKDAGSDHDFGKNVIPHMVERDKVFAYPMPGRWNKPPYWRDIGTLDSYWEASMDLVRHDPPINLYDPSWPIRTHQDQRPPALLRRGGGNDPVVLDTILVKGARITGARLERSVISVDNVISPGADVSESVLMSRVSVGEGAKVRRTIVDKDVRIPPGESVGYDRERDRERFLITENGIVVIPRNYVFV